MDFGLKLTQVTTEANIVPKHKMSVCSWFTQYCKLRHIIMLDDIQRILKKLT